jgi:hypothetical protein
MLVTEWMHDMNIKKPLVGSEYVMAYFVLHFIPGGQQIILQLEMEVPKFRHASSVEAAATADVGIANAFVTVPFTLGWVGE